MNSRIDAINVSPHLAILTGFILPLSQGEMTWGPFLEAPGNYRAC